VSVDVWSTIHAERASLATDLQALSDAQWTTPSLCSGWSVRDVLAHMTATARMTPPRFLLKMLASGFSFQKLQARDIAVERGAAPAETLARFRAAVNLSSHPPGPTTSWLGEVLVHAEDIRRPLGIQHMYPIDACVQTADFYKGSNLIIGAKSRIEGLRVRATDAAWAHGAGPEVAGPIHALVMAMTGRKAAIGDLSGEGLTLLESRCQ
jgi:uncharacterized protein (TIGR03083 family)